MIMETKENYLFDYTQWNEKAIKLIPKQEDCCIISPPCNNYY